MKLSDLAARGVDVRAADFDQPETLAADDFSNSVIEITGPSAVTVDEVAAMVAEVTGRPLRHRPVDASTLKGILAGAGFPPPLVGAFLAFDLATAQGFHATVTPAVAVLTGKAPMPLGMFLEANRSALLGTGEP